jgi:hypothetical protein
MCLHEQEQLNTATGFGLGWGKQGTMRKTKHRLA